MKGKGFFLRNTYYVQKFIDLLLECMDEDVLLQDKLTLSLLAWGQVRFINDVYICLLSGDSPPSCRLRRRCLPEQQQIAFDHAIPY